MIKVWSDKYKRYREEMNVMGLDAGEIVPIDLYGKQVALKKDDPDNLAKIGRDIKEVYGLTDY